MQKNPTSSTMPDTLAGSSKQRVRASVRNQPLSAVAAETVVAARSSETMTGGREGRGVSFALST
jgi:hypothetical protein